MISWRLISRHRPLRPRLEAEAGDGDEEVAVDREVFVVRDLAVAVDDLVRNLCQHLHRQQP
jgi:hypothetical protein